MKYSIEGFSQSELIKMGLDNTDAVILRWFSDFQGTGMMKELPPGAYEKYQWVSYQAVIDDLPCLGITNREVMARRFKKLCSVGVLEFLNYKHEGTFTCFRKTQGFMSLCSSVVYSKVDRGSTRESSTPDSKVDPKTLLLNSSIKKQDFAKAPRRYKTTPINLVPGGIQ